MSLITVEFTIPANTKINDLNKQIFDLGINAKFIKACEIIIPVGHKGLAYMRAYTPGFQIIPDTGSSVPYIRGDDSTVKANINRPLEGPPYNLFCEGYNMDVSLPHTFVINIEA